MSENHDDTEVRESGSVIIALEDALMKEKIRRHIAEHDARHMRQVLELIAEQPGSRKSRYAATCALTRTKRSPWLTVEAAP